MKIKEITLFTNKLLKQKYFFKHTLGLPYLTEKESEFSVNIGWTILTFRYNPQDYKYHYCFLIPSNKLDESISWLKERLDIIKIDGAQIIQNFKSWNASSGYFYDGVGNLAEFIVRYDLKNGCKKAFDFSQVLCVNEIGMPISNVRGINNQLEKHTGSKFWKGDLERFGTNGSQEGIFLLINNKVKMNWFPTDLITQASPFEIGIEVDAKKHKFKFSNQQISF